jgi:hypothetical protein
MSSYDPMKSSLMQSHLNHKSKVSTLKSQFTSQKLHEKKILTKQIELLKTQIIQTLK